MAFSKYERQFSDPNYWLTLLNTPIRGTGEMVSVGSGIPGGIRNVTPAITPSDRQTWQTQQDAYKLGLTNAIKNLGSAAPSAPLSNASAGSVSAGVPSAPPVPGLPDILSGGTAYAPGAGGGQAGQALNVISGLLNTNPDTSEWDQTSAERAVAGGIPGSRTAAAEGSLLRQSEIDKRNLAGLEALNPFLNRQQSTFELIEKGRQAKDLLRMSEAGQMERLNAENKARLEQIAAQGENALAQTRLSGEFSLAGNQIGANTSLSNAALSAGTSRANAQTAADTARYVADARQSRGPSSAAQSLIDQILRGAGITVPPAYSTGGGSGFMEAPPPRTVPADDYDFDFYDAPTYEDDYAYA